MKKTIEPLGDRVIIKSPESGDRKSKRGKIIIQESSTRGESTWGEVLLVGPGIYTQTGDLIPTSVNVGDLVLYKKEMVGDKITIDEIDYIMFREHDLMMVDRKSPKYDMKQLLKENIPQPPLPPKSRKIKEGDMTIPPSTNYKSEF